MSEKKEEAIREQSGPERPLLLVIRCVELAEKQEDARTCPKVRQAGRRFARRSGCDPHPKPKAVLLAELGASRAELESVLTHVPPERMTEPGACGLWSVKDVLVHLAVENEWLALQLERRARGEVKSPEELERNRELGLDDNGRRNTYYAQLHKDLDLAYVRDWDRRANERLLTALAALPESRLLEPDWWTFGRALGSVFDVDHDREHAQDIQRWLEQN